MKKIVFTLLIAFVTLTSYSQEFTFKRAFSQIPGVGSQFLKLQGSFSVSDTLVILKSNGITQSFNVITTSKGTNAQQFKIKVVETFDIRISLIPNPTPTKNEDYLITIETLDKFTNSNTTTMYYLTLSK
jgi:hypothetical protein